MDPLTLSLALVAALLAAVCAWLFRERYRLMAERDVARARLSDREETRHTFESLASETLRASNAEFLRLANEALASRETRTFAEIDQRRRAMDELVQPIRDVLQKTQEEMQRVGKGHEGLREQVDAMHRSNRQLREETGRLVQALRKPNVRGRYGEIQLERVVELAGLREYCDFTTQENLRDTGGKLQKPDLVVRLPNDRLIAVDAKTSIDGYIDALEAKTPEQQAAALARYAENVTVQVQRLSKKEYWSHFEHSPEFVVMFIPGDQLVDAALRERPKLLELAAERNVIIASPSTLIGLLRAVHVGWRERSLSDSATELFSLGRELHERAAIVLDHAAQVGDSLRGAQEAYNRFVSSVDARLVPTLRRFEDGGARSAKELRPPSEIDGTARRLRSLPRPEEEIVPHASNPHAPNPHAPNPHAPNPHAPNKGRARDASA